MTSPTEARTWLLPTLMSFVAAYVDTVGFVALGVVCATMRYEGAPA